MKKPRYIGIELGGHKILVDLKEGMVEVKKRGSRCWEHYEKYVLADTCFDDKDKLIKQEA